VPVPLPLKVSKPASDAGALLPLEIVQLM